MQVQGPQRFYWHCALVSFCAGVLCRNASKAAGQCTRSGPLLAICSRSVGGPRRPRAPRRAVTMSESVDIYCFFPPVFECLNSGGCCSLFEYSSSSSSFLVAAALPCPLAPGLLALHACSSAHRAVQWQLVSLPVSPRLLNSQFTSSPGVSATAALPRALGGRLFQSSVLRGNAEVKSRIGPIKDWFVVGIPTHLNSRAPDLCHNKPDL